MIAAHRHIRLYTGSRIIPVARLKNRNAVWRVSGVLRQSSGMSERKRSSPRDVRERGHRSLRSGKPRSGAPRSPRFREWAIPKGRQGWRIGRVPTRDHRRRTRREPATVRRSC